MVVIVEVVVAVAVAVASFLEKSRFLSALKYIKFDGYNLKISVISLFITSIFTSVPDISLVVIIITKPRTKYRFHTTSILLYYILKWNDRISF